MTTRSWQSLFLALHAFVELSVAALMVTASMPPPYDTAFAEAHSVVRGFAGGGAAAVGLVGVLTLTSHIPRRVGLAFCGGYQLFIALNEGLHESMMFPGGLAEAQPHILVGIGPHVLLGAWGVVLAARAETDTTNRASRD